MTVKSWDALWALYKPRRVKGKKTEKETIRVFETYIRPSLGPKSVARTTFETIEGMHVDLKDTPYQANRVLSLIRPMFKYAQALKWIEPGHNPAKHVIMYREKKRRRHLHTEEAPKLATAIRSHEATSPDACWFLWAMIFSGARPKELKSALWANLKGNRIVLADHKSDHKGTDRVIVLPPIVMDKLKNIPRGQPWQKIIRIKNPEYIWRSIRKEAGCRDMRIYDLRHTFATYALEKGFSLDQIGESLEHANPATTKIYAEMNLRSRQKIAMDTSLAILDDMLIREVSA